MSAISTNVYSLWNCSWLAFKLVKFMQCLDLLQSTQFSLFWFCFCLKYSRTPIWFRILHDLLKEELFLKAKIYIVHLAFSHWKGKTQIEMRLLWMFRHITNFMFFGRSCFHFCRDLQKKYIIHCLLRCSSAMFEPCSLHFRICNPEKKYLKIIIFERSAVYFH